MSGGPGNCTDQKPLTPIIRLYGSRLARIGILLVLLVTQSFLLPSCGNPSSATSILTPEIVVLSYPPSLLPLVNHLSACANQDAGISLYLNETIRINPPGAYQNLYLKLGGNLDGLEDFTATLMYQESIILIAHPSNRTPSLSFDEVQALFSSEPTAWLNGEVVQVWLYPEGDEIRRLFDEVFLQGQQVNPQAFIAPDPMAMLKAVSAEPGAIGYLPSSWLEGNLSGESYNVKMILYEDVSPERLSLPIIALSAGEPQGAIRRLLLCGQMGE